MINDSQEMFAMVQVLEILVICYAKGKCVLLPNICAAYMISEEFIARTLFIQASDHNCTHEADFNLQPRSSACWTAQLLSAFQGLRGCESYVQLFKLGVLFPCKSLLQI